MKAKLTWFPRYGMFINILNDGIMGETTLGTKQFLLPIHEWLVSHKKFSVWDFSSWLRDGVYIGWNWDNIPDYLIGLCKEIEEPLVGFLPLE